MNSTKKETRDKDWALYKKKRFDLLKHEQLSNSKILCYQA